MIKRDKVKRPKKKLIDIVGGGVFRKKRVWKKNIPHVVQARAPRPLRPPLHHLDRLDRRRKHLEPHLDGRALQLVAQQDARVGAAPPDVQAHAGKKSAVAAGRHGEAARRYPCTSSPSSSTLTTATFPTASAALVVLVIVVAVVVAGASRAAAAAAAAEHRPRAHEQNVADARGVRVVLGEERAARAAGVELGQQLLRHERQRLARARGGAGRRRVGLDALLHGLQL